MKYIVCNWKMNPKSLEEVDILFTYYKQALSSVHSHQVILLPPIIYLEHIINLQKEVYIELGVQDISDQPKGAYTGQISAQMAHSLGATYTLIGHSETHRYLGYSHDIISAKLHQAIDNSLIPIVCVGYDLESDTINFDSLEKELDTIFSQSNKDHPPLILIAYEPTWAIGSGKTPTSEEITTVAIFIKKWMKKSIDTEVRILYGGSVDKDNIHDIISYDHIDGVLIGGASIDSMQITGIIHPSKSK